MQKVSLGAAMLHGKCPGCRKGDIFPNSLFSFRKLSEVNQNCPTCGVSLNPEPDFYYGAMYISYGFSVALMINVLFILNFLFDDPDVWVYALTVLSANIILMPVMLRYSKVLYLYGLGKTHYNPQGKKQNKI